MTHIQVIKASAQTPVTEDEIVKKLRVAAYCRVSTDTEEQESSYEVQCAHYTEYINSNPAWILAGIYADEGISGTSTRNRTEFQKMITSCEAGEIDMVITKSISRWSRNTVDSLNSIRKLRSLDIPVFFEKESINTADANGEVLITILASLAQQESDSISKNVRMGIQYHMQQGKRRFNAHPLLGYQSDGSINPAEAGIVRRIFREYLEGYSPDKIALHLTEAGILTATGRKVWNPSSILMILENEKYIGDFLMQKYYVKDFLSHNRVRNEGALPQYLIQNDHDPIVPRAIFTAVQDEIQRRAYLKYTPNLLRQGSKEALSGRLVCSTCGKILKKHTAPSLTDWRCMVRPKKVKRYQKGNCTFIAEKKLKKAILNAFNELPKQKNKLLRMQARIEYQLQDAAPLVDSTSAADKKYANHHTVSSSALKKDNKEELVAGNMRQILDRAELYRQFFQIHILLELIGQMEEKRLTFWKHAPSEKTIAPPSCTDFDDFMRRTRYAPPEGVISASGRIVEFNDAFIIRYLEKVTVNRTVCTVKFKAGIEVDVVF